MVHVLENSPQLIFEKFELSQEEYKWNIYLERIDLNMNQEGL